MVRGNIGVKIPNAGDISVKMAEFHFIFDAQRIIVAINLETRFFGPIQRFAVKNELSLCLGIRRPDAAIDKIATIMLFKIRNELANPPER